MRTLRLSLAGTIILALLGGLGAVVLAQGEAEPATWVSGPETQAPCEVGDVESLIHGAFSSEDLGAPFATIGVDLATVPSAMSATHTTR